MRVWSRVCVCRLFVLGLRAQELIDTRRAGVCVCINLWLFGILWFGLGWRKALGFGRGAKERRVGGEGPGWVFIVLCLCNISSKAGGVGHADVDGVE
jgi:hypothetical protein